MQHKIATNLVSVFILAGVIVVALANARTLRSQEQSAFYHPFPPEVIKAVNAQSKLARNAELRARQLLNAHRFEEARQECTQTLTLWPKINGKPFVQPSTYQLLGDINREQGHYQEAIDSYLKARKNNPYDKELDLGIALTYLKMGDITNARKFYDEDTFFGAKGDLSSAEKVKHAEYMAQLPGTQTAKAMEASIYYARGREKSGHCDLKEAIEDYKKVLAMDPHNALAATSIASAFDRLDSTDGTPYWARAAVFGKGNIARDAQRELHNRLVPDKIESALDEARKIEG